MATRDEALPFPPSPASVPAGLTAASPAYTRSAWIAVAGLLAFVAIYLGLTGYLAWLVYRTFGRALMDGHDQWLAFFVSLPAMFFLAFLVRGLFLVRHQSPDDLLEVSPASEPALFAFLHRLADETGAPRPHRVFLSARVNAGVFYDLSFFNLLIPSKKNLELGLGLVNALSLDELKAVLAHEYGHFAQRSMAVGRWVYLARQIAGHVVASRGAFDNLLAFISSIDLRVAWIGWIMRVFVWAIRAVLDTVLRVAVLAQRALGREMELQADRVAVSVSGSDSLIHALHRLGPADEAWGNALPFVDEEWRAGRAVGDLFAIQDAILAHLRTILGEADFGATPVRPDHRPERHRVFDSELAQPPRMWMTHPPNREREDSAKQLYVPSTLDERSAWTLFRDPEATRREVTTLFLSLLRKDAAGKITLPEKPVAPLTESLARLEERWSRASLDPRYRGAYLGRAVAAHFESADAMTKAEGAGDATDRDAVLARLEALYPPSLREDLTLYRERREEVGLLEGLADGVLTAPGGIIRHRGREIRRAELAAVIDSAKGERAEVESRVLAHDRLCHAAHLDAARLLGRGWDRYLRSLLGLLHYSAREGGGLGAAHGIPHHGLQIGLADGRVSNAERQRLLVAAADLQSVLERLWHEKTMLSLPPAVNARFVDLEGFTVMKDDLGARDPSEQNLGDWLQIIDGWALGAAGDLKVLSDVTLDTLLHTEEAIARQLREGIDPGEAPEPATMPARYHVRLVGNERERQKKLDWWDRFQTADGFVPGTARFLVASGLLVPALLLGAQVGESTVHVLNALPIPVVVVIEERQYRLGSGAHQVIEHGPGVVQIETTTARGESIERFEAEIGGGFGSYAYVVGQAAPLVEWTATYGNAAQRWPRYLGAPRWIPVAQDHVFEEPATSVSVGAGGGTTRTVLTAIEAIPSAIDEMVPDPAQREALVRAHLRWEPASSRQLLGWASLAAGEPTRIDELRRRAEAGDGVALSRALMDVVSPEERAQLCAAHTARAESTPTDPGAAYLAIRCLEDPELRGAALENAYAVHPSDGWLALGAANRMAGRGEWRDAMQAFGVTLGNVELGSVHDQAVLLATRTQRAQHRFTQEASPIEPATPGDGVVGVYLQLEGAAQPEEPPSFAALRSIARGQLEDATARSQVISADPSQFATVIALVGASDGASTAQIASALAVDPTLVSDAALYALVGLASREGRSVDVIRRELEARGSDVDPRFFQALASPTLAEQWQLLDEIGASRGGEGRGMALMAGVGRLGPRAPQRWREEALVLLFAPERPYFAPVLGVLGTVGGAGIADVLRGDDER